MKFSYLLRLIFKGRIGIGGNSSRIGRCLNQEAIREPKNHTQKEKRKQRQKKKKKKKKRDGFSHNPKIIDFSSSNSLPNPHTFNSSQLIQQLPKCVRGSSGVQLPNGLLPKGMKGYDLNSSTGEFSAYFNETCSFSVQGSYELKFSSTVTGYISKDTLSGLDGISVKFFLLTLNIVGIIRNGDNLVISAGVESAPFPIDNF
ncbi:hypothetical protein CK203_021197 [Vitis vinifera]|uniref:Uncharacterized protein n=1 Tax=Vitis vinifera TaxID=29760 RepID=A0A438IML1_VITVI|nr:hypothetical protein CK203_021197 [Vitis vinifera]